MDSSPCDMYDDILMNLLFENKTLFNFLFSIFGFLKRKTDFYMIYDENNEESVGFPPGVAEELVVRILRKCDPYNTLESEELDFKTCPAQEYVPDTVAQEVEIETTEFESHSECNPIHSKCQINNENEDNNSSSQSEDVNVELMEKLSIDNTKNGKSKLSQDVSSNCNKKSEPDAIKCEELDKFNSESQKDSETYNGAKREHYNWSQRIGELDVTVHLPLNVKSSKQVKVNITSNTFGISCEENGSWHSLIQDALSHKIKSGETLWVMSEGKLRIHCEKQDERWWRALLESEPKIDTSRIDCSRPLDDLPEEQLAKVRELRWNEIQKLTGNPTSEQIQKQNILKKAWNVEGSPFMNTPFDPSILQ